MTRTLVGVEGLSTLKIGWQIMRRESALYSTHRAGAGWDRAKEEKANPAEFAHDMLTALWVVLKLIRPFHQDSKEGTS